MVSWIINIFKNLNFSLQVQHFLEHVTHPGHAHMAQRKQYWRLIEWGLSRIWGRVCNLSGGVWPFRATRDFCPYREMGYPVRLASRIRTATEALHGQDFWGRDLLFAQREWHRGRVVSGHADLGFRRFWHEDAWLSEMYGSDMYSCTCIFSRRCKLTILDLWSRFILWIVSEIYIICMLFWQRRELHAQIWVDTCFLKVLHQFKFCIFKHIFVDLCIYFCKYYTYLRRYFVSKFVNCFPFVFSHSYFVIFAVKNLALISWY